MADRNQAAGKTVWTKQAEEAKLKNEAEKAAAAKAAFEATFKDVNKNNEASASTDSEAEEEAEEDLANKPIGPVDPGKCTAAGAGIAGGTACSSSTFTVVTKDADGRKVPLGGAQIKVKITPAVGVGGSEQDGIVKDMADGTYSVTYMVSKRGNYMVSIECNGKPIMGSPFPVFFSSGTTTGGLLGLAPAATFPNVVNQNMPNMPNYMGSVSGSFPGLLGTIPGMVSGVSGGVLLPGIGASCGEVCQEYLYGRCAKTDCKFNHPPQNLLMTALAATTTMGTLSQVPMAPSAAAMAAARAIVAARALQAHTTQAQPQTPAQPVNDFSGPADKDWKADSLKKTLQVSNLSPLLTVDQLKQLFGFCGTVVECIITDSKHFAYIEYSKPEEATAALALNNMDVGGRPLNVEMAKSLPPKPALLNSPLASSSLPVMMQQAVAMQQMQFQQALLMQQAMTAQQAANRAATMKSATELAAARAAEISQKLKADGFANEEEETNKKSRSRSPVHRKSRSKSKSPTCFRRRRRSRSLSHYCRYSRDHRSRSPLRSRHYTSYELERRSYRDIRGSNDKSRRDSGGSHDRRLRRDRSASPRRRKPDRDESESPKRHRERPSYRIAKSSHANARSPEHHRGSKSSPRRDDENKLKRRRRSRSRSLEVKHNNDIYEIREEKPKRRERRRSRSGSVEGKHLKESTLSLETTNDIKSKRKRRSRSRSLEHKHMSSGKTDRSREERSRHHYKRHSRSPSPEGRRHKGSKVSLRRSESKRRRRSRSDSTGAGHHSNDNGIDESKDSSGEIRESKGNGKRGKRHVKSNNSMAEVDFELKDSGIVGDDNTLDSPAGTRSRSFVVMDDDIIDGGSGSDHKNSLRDKNHGIAEAATEK